jgi:hypothetical protein
MQIAMTAGKCQIHCVIIATVFDGHAWLKGAEVSGAKLRYNQYVRVIAGQYAGRVGAIVAIDPRTKPEPVYTVEIYDDDPNAEIPESLLEPAE